MKNIKNLIWEKLEKFSVAQMTSNSNGKTSGSGTMGILTVLVGLITFLMGSIDFIVEGRTEIMTQSVIVIGIGVGLLGYRKSKSDPVIEPPTTDEQSPEIKI